MAISKKTKRVVLINSQKFFWWVFNEWDQTEFDGIQTKIIPENQKFYIKYGIEQDNHDRYIVISLRENKSKIHLYCPKFESENQVLTNKGIKNIIEWCSKALNNSDKKMVQHAYKSNEGIIKFENYDEVFKEIVNVF